MSPPEKDRFLVFSSKRAEHGDAARVPTHRWRGLSVWLAITFLVAFAGCGTTKQFEATEQLLLSDAVDDSVGAIDFRPLSGFRVYLDTQYIRAVKGPAFVNADYVISALRQQIASAGCLLQENVAEADIIIEPRVGTLGADGFQVTYGIPSNSTLATAAQMIPGIPALPVIPELSLARREAREGSAKIAAFAYDRLTRQPIWQSGIARSSTTSKDTWVLGIGPIQTGTIRNGTRIVGSGLYFDDTNIEGWTPQQLFDRPPVNYNAQVRFQDGEPILGPRVAGPGMLATSAESEPAPEANAETTGAAASAEAQVAEAGADTSNQ